MIPILYEYIYSIDRPIDIVNAYFANFEMLAQSEKWKEIFSQGVIALEAAKRAERPQDEAKISAQLASTTFYLGDYTQALAYARHCRELAEMFVDATLLIRAFYLESAAYRALAPKSGQEQIFYQLAIQIAEEALHLYRLKSVDHLNLQGKLYFNLGAAHADNPKGDLICAETHYIKALECFSSVHATDDLIRTTLRLGKVYFLQQKYDRLEKMIEEIRPQLTTERLAMHTDYLEAQLKFALNDIDNGIRIARVGLFRAKALGAKEDESRFTCLLQAMESI